MKSLLAFPLISIGILSFNQTAIVNSSGDQQKPAVQADPVTNKMPAAVFKNQDFFRAEIPDFPFDVHFEVKGATVYFSGANFNAVQRGAITSGSLEPVKKLMQRCGPGSIIVFDDVKVLGPDNRLRQIQSTSIVLF
ncbi:MAG: hypothetical protein QM791_11015 [Ferruginibacter sp.]